MSFIVLLCSGIILVVVEILFASFFLLFAGIGFIITAILEYFIGFEVFGNAYVWQAISICVFSFISLIVLKKPIKSWFADSQTYEDSLQNGSGIGEIRQGMVYFKGSLWAYEILDSTTLMHKQNDMDSKFFKDGDKVEVLEIRDNKVIIKYG